MTYYTMVRTSTPEFCATCHEIKPAVRAWRASTHANNAAGVVVDCMDCHLPAPQNTFDFLFAKTYHGIKDVAVHFMAGEYDRKKARTAAYAAFERVLKYGPDYEMEFNARLNLAQNAWASGKGSAGDAVKTLETPCFLV